MNEAMTGGESRTAREAAKAGLRRWFPNLFDRLRSARLRRPEPSFAQEGEDKILARYFETHPRGSFVDVGAHDPLRFSNTYLFYRRGWRGVNIDAMPGSMRLFEKYRPGDRNIEVGVGRVPSDLPFYVFQEPALNSFDAELSLRRKTDGSRLLDIVNVPIRPLADILSPHLHLLVEPSFLTIDVEGRDLDVLQSNDWRTFRPTIVLAECLGATVESAVRSAVTEFMRSHGYSFVAKTLNTGFYLRDAAA
jgi:FkbM family methyltransferase